ncbi:hypothetical protein G9A89_021158 [Geosiphon pyriformis]|nr:hypothetical protein G9A89_021158 [Geosiphon pyriformis]
MKGLRCQKYSSTLTLPDFAEVDDLIFMVYQVLITKLRIVRSFEHLSGVKLTSNKNLNDRFKGKKANKR